MNTSWVQHLEAFIGPGALPVLRQSYELGLTPGGADHGQVDLVKEVAHVLETGRKLEVKKHELPKGRTGL